MLQAVRSGLTDRELMLRFAERQDRKAFEELVCRWDRRVFSFLAKASGDPEAAKDLRQDVFIRVLKYGATYDANRAFSTWLFGIARNVLATWQKKQSRGRRLGRSNGDTSLLLVPDVTPGPGARAISAERDGEIRRVMDGLAPADRELLLLRMDLDMNYREIGELLDMPETTVKSRMYSLLKRVRIELQHTSVSEDTDELEPCERM